MSDEDIPVGGVQTYHLPCNCKLITTREGDIAWHGRLCTVRDPEGKICQMRGDEYEVLGLALVLYSRMHECRTLEETRHDDRKPVSVA